MNIKITVLFFVIVMSGCATNPILVTGADGQLEYTLNCNSGTEKCYQKAAELCADGYDVIDHTKKSSTVIPNYGQNPMVINIENLIIKCK